MADQTQRLEIATVKAEVGSKILYLFSNAPEDAQPIATDSGEIRNLKQVIAAIREEGAEKISIATTIYQTPAAGLAATDVGGIFLVQSTHANSIYDVWKNQAGSAVNTGKTAMSSEAIQIALDASNEAALAAEDAADVATNRTAGFLKAADSAPVARDNGLPLQIGDRYFNTVDQVEYLYKAEGWSANDSLAAIAVLEQELRAFEEHQRSNRVNASDFGATAGESSDSTVAINSAIEYCSSVGGGTVHLNSGVFMTSGIVLRDLVVLKGSGRRITTIKLMPGSNTHVITAGDFDNNADGVVKQQPIGCRSAGLLDLTIDGNKSGQSAPKHGFAHYGVDLLLSNVEIKQCKGKGLYTESPGGTYSVAAGQNLQYSISSVECHHNDLGNIHYNGQSDSNISDVLCYECGGNQLGQVNLFIGSKASGARFVGGHCWGVSAYGIVNEAEAPEFSDFHVESASIAKVWAKEKISWNGGHLYEAGSNNSAKAFKLDKDYNNIRGVRATNIRGGLVDLSSGGVAGFNSVLEVFGYTSATGSVLFTGSLPASSDIELRLFGLTSSSFFQSSQKQVLPGGVDLNSGGVDRANYFAGQGWAVVPSPGTSISISTSFVNLNDAASATITDIASTAGQQGILEITIRNSGAGAKTFVHDPAKLRNNSGANVVLSQHQSIRYTQVSGSIWQQTGGKV